MALSGLRSTSPVRVFKLKKKDTGAADLSLLLVIDRSIPGINQTPFFFETDTNLDHGNFVMYCWWRYYGAFGGIQMDFDMLTVPFKY